MTKTNVISMLIHAPSKEGKSTLTSTAPTPHLVLDAEGSWKFIRTKGFKTGIPLRKKLWDPLVEEIPQWDDTWDVLHVRVTSWEIMRQTYLHLTQSEHQVRTLTLDSITEVQRRCKKNIKGTGPMQIQQWGELLDRMDDLIRSFRDLTLQDTNPIENVLFVAETRYSQGKWRPYMQGQIENTLPYWVDVCGYLWTENVLDEKGEATGKVKKLLISPHDTYVAGERVQGALPDVITAPNITDMIQLIYPS